MSDLQKLRNQRAEVVTQMRTLHATAEKEERRFTEDEDNKWNVMVADLEKLDARIRRADQLDAAGQVVPSSLRAANQLIDQQNDDKKAESDDEKRVFEKFLRHGIGGLSQEERSLMAARRDTSNEARAFSQGTGNTGGYIVPQDFRNKLEIALKMSGGMLAVADVMRTDTGATLPMPTFNYTNVLATIVGENAASSSDSSTPFGVANLGAFTYRSPILPVSYEFLQDSAFGETFIIDALSGAIARAMNAHFTTGSGTGQPRGVVTDAASGKVGTTGQTLTVIVDDLVDLIHSIDPAYRASGCVFMMHDTSLKVVRKIKDAQGRPIFMPGYDGLSGAMSDQILGYNISINQDVAVMAASAKSILFGRFDKYKARMVKDITLMRLVERYADNLQVAFLLFARADGRLLDAGTNPVKYYQNSAT